MNAKTSATFVYQWVFLFLLGITLFFPGLLPARPSSLEGYAEEIVNRCAEKKYRPSCYDEEIPKLMDAISMEDAFKVTSLVQEKDTSYRYCHVLGHALSAREVQKEPSKWKEVVVRCPSGLCSNGCIHGGFQERFRAESFTDAQILALKPDLVTLCEERPNWHPTGLEQASCYHALGHLTMYLTAADIRASIALCEEVAVKPDGRDYSQLCFDGAFMQIFQPLEPEDFALVKGKEVPKEQLASFCAGFNGAKRGSCWTEGWPLFRAELQEPRGLVTHCSKAEPEERARCYDALFYVLTAQFGFDEKRIVPYCTGLTGEIRDRCFANAASRMIETDYRNIHSAVRLCSVAGSMGDGQACFAELLKYSTYNFHPDSEAFLELCQSLPNPWNEKCLKKERG